MAYTTQQAIETLNGYLNIRDDQKSVIADTKNRGYVVDLNSGEQVVIFIYPLVHKQDNTKNYFDTRDSGAYERGVAWRYAIENGLKYFCFGVNDQVDKYNEYIFSLECNETIIEKISGTKNGARNGPGNQIIIPNDYIPSKEYERIKNRLGIYISVIRKNCLYEYLEMYDNRPYLPEDYVEDTASDESENQESEEAYMPLVFNTELETKYERNRIVFGAPGTGKSYELKEDCEDLLKDAKDNYERVTFHPDYSYSQFVGTYKPVMGADEKIRYDFVPGPFMRVYVEALKSGRTENPQPHLLLIEEINRAKVAAVFGDVFQLLDRDDDGVSEYEIQASEDIRKYLAKQLGGTPDNYQKIRIPNNMFIWSTLNSADQGVFPMDTAFKRRWNFEYLGINENEEKISGIGKIELAGSDEPVEWNILRRAINAKMSSEQFKINEDKLMGPFFLSKKIIASDENGMIIDTDKCVAAFNSKVIMYLYEDAVKQGKHRFFDGCDNSKYSSVCDAFDELGMGIFGPNFKENFYDKQRDEV